MSLGFTGRCQDYLPTHLALHGLVMGSLARGSEAFSKTFGPWIVRSRIAWIPSSFSVGSQLPRCLACTERPPGALVVRVQAPIGHKDAHRPATQLHLKAGGKASDTPYKVSKRVFYTQPMRSPAFHPVQTGSVGGGAWMHQALKSARMAPGSRMSWKIPVGLNLAPQPSCI